MKNMMAEQRGMTFIGIVFVIGFIVIVTLFVLRAFPLFYERTQVIAAMESVANREGSSKFSSKQVHRAFMRAINVTNIDRFTDSNIKEFLLVEKAKKRGDPKVMHLNYQATNKLAGGLQLLLMVDESVLLTKAGTGE